MLLQLRGRNEQNRRPGWLERKTDVQRAMQRWRIESPEVGPDGLSPFHEVWAKVMLNRSWNHASPSIPQIRPLSSCSSLSVPTHLLDKCSWGGKHWKHMCHSGQRRLEMCYKESFFPFPLPSFFPSLLITSFSSPYPTPPSLPSSFFLPSFFSFFHSISLNTTVWKTVVEEKCQEVQMQIWYIWPFFSSEQ